MKIRLITLACCIASTALAQTGGGYLGPAVLSSGANGAGNRSGQQVDLRFYAGVNGVYDSSVQPVSVDSKGDLVTVKGLEGVEASVGAYGSHSWKRATLGLDYHGSFRAYNSNSSYDGIDQALALGFTLQESRRIVYNGQVLAGTISNGLGGVGGIYPAFTSNVVSQATSLLFDNRSSYVQGGLDVTLVQSARTSYSFGGQGFEVWRQSPDLVGVEGYSARATVEHKLSKHSSVGFTYQRQHFDYPKAYGQADIDTGELFYGTNLGRLWSLTVRGGVFRAEVTGLQTVELPPAVAAILGQSTSIQTLYQQNIFPSGQATLNRRFKTANLVFFYGQTVVPGNGVYLTSKSDSGGASYSYTGIRKVNLGVSGGYSSLSSIGQGIQPYRVGNGGAGFTYALPKSLHLVARYDLRYQAIENLTYKHTGFRATIGLTFSPGKVPLSLW